MSSIEYKMGIDIGSTTAKLLIADKDNNIIKSDYRRHNAKAMETLLMQLSEFKDEFAGKKLSVSITGTAGMGVSEKANIHFIQEVVAAADVVKIRYKDVRTLIDLGGEDAKIIFFNDELKPNIRMNGNCAGGTGAFIDQMASLLNVELGELNGLAENSSHSYPIASRCGVFAKTDVQSLISRDVPAEDIAASIFKAVALQTVNSLARGFDINAKILFAGGPLTFIPQLRKAFIETIKINEDDVVSIDRPEFIPAYGAAISDDDEKTIITIDELMENVRRSQGMVRTSSAALPKLFKDKEEYNEWKARKESFDAERTTLADLSEEERQKLFLGIDSGSTTTKVVITDEKGRLIYDYYSPNNGKPVETVISGLHKFYEEVKGGYPDVNIARGGVTGYGEDLIRAAFGIDEGHVETIAHYKAAASFNKDVSFILDIGGQDMKAIFIKDGLINNLEINEACSSGAGSFIQTFSKSLGYEVWDFADEACGADFPCDLGTRCTVFMNSKVKQALREGASVGDIAAGLAYSVIKNCFNKLLKITDTSIFGDTIVVQGGTFKNMAVLRAMELILGKEVIRPGISELMGAYGTALIARDDYLKEASKSEFIGFDKIDTARNYDRKSLTCKGCENLCRITKLSFSKDVVFYTGNKCEKIFSNKGSAEVPGENLPEYKLKLIFDRKMEPEGEAKAVIGIPRALNMYENFPFWNTLFTELGFKVLLSAKSSATVADKGAGTVMSENICFPAKITHGHIIDLVEKGVDRIFYPMVRYEAFSSEDAINSYNCPVVTGYPDVIESSLNPEKKHGIPFDSPSVSFASEKLIKKSARAYFEGLGISRGDFKKAFKKALKEQDEWKEKLKEEAAQIIARNEESGRPMIMLIGRPYHIDPLVNHKIPEMISALGVDMITEDSLPDNEELDLKDSSHVITQWSFPNRLYNAAIWAGERPNVQLVQMNSFGCGPDAITVDEVKGILNEYGKNPTLIRIDEITSGGSIKLRLRSLVESIFMRETTVGSEYQKRSKSPAYTKADRKKKIIAPLFAPFYTSFITATFKDMGYDIETLPMPDRESVEIGLKYTNNDICYPATIVIGDLIKALQSGKYNRDEVVVAMSQTGGQCRASSYISLLKKGLANAGYGDLPVVAVSTGGSTINDQPGFKVDKVRLNVNGLFSMLFSDVIAKMYYYTAIREVNKGEALELSNKYLKEAEELIGFRNINKLFKLMEKAVADFNKIEIIEKEHPRVGIVGEIYVKYNPFGNDFVVDWLMSKGIEVEISPLIDFFMKKLISEEYNANKSLQKKNKLFVPFLNAAERIVNHYIKKANKVMKGFRVYKPFHTIREVAEKGEQILSLVNQFGESWLLPAEIAMYAEDGVNDVLCLQPFGCIANHVIARGVEKKLKDLYPLLNLLYLDMDAGTSEVNTLNRLQFLVKGALDSAKELREKDKPKEEERV